MRMTTAARLSSPRPRSAELLVATGVLLGAVFTLGKVAVEGGVAPLGYAFAMTSGAAALLAGFAAVRAEKLPLSGRNLRYYALSGLFSMALPNAIFSVIPHLGAGLASVVYALPSLLTLAMTAAFRIGPAPNLSDAIGVALGAAGTLLIVGPSEGVLASQAWPWMVLALTIPLSIAVGNVYRTVDWPEGTEPLPLAAGMLLGASGCILVGVAAADRFADLATVFRAPAVVAVQAGVTAVAFVLHFRLQRAAGPVYLSQIGYIMTATGLVSGMVIFAESYPPVVWFAALLIATGVLFTTRARR